MLAMTCQQVEDDGIYKIYQICTAPFSNSRSILSHPVKQKAWFNMALFILLSIT